MLLKQSTSAIVLVGPVLDASGVAVTTAVIGDFTLTKNGTSAALSGNTISHSHNGHYAITLTTGNTDTIGRLTISTNNASYAMPVFRWDICQPTVYDALFTNAVNTSGGLPAATGAISTLAGAISTFAGGAVGSVTAAVTVGTNNDKTGYSLTAGTGLGNQTANITGNLSGSVGSVTGAVASVTNRVTANVDQWNSVTVTGMPMPTYTQPTGFLAAAFPATVSSFAGGAVASVTGNVGGNVVGSVGSIAGVTFPTHFQDLEIAANGHVSAAVQSIANNSITASSIQGGAITAAKFATDAITAAALAADAVSEIQAGLATAANQTIIIDRVTYGLTALVGACSDAQTAAETYTLTIGGSTYTVDYSGLDSSGNRSTTTLSKV